MVSKVEFLSTDHLQMEDLDFLRQFNFDKKAESFYKNSLEKGPQIANLYSKQSRGYLSITCNKIIYLKYLLNELANSIEDQKKRWKSGVKMEVSGSRIKQVGVANFLNSAPNRKDLLLIESSITVLKSILDSFAFYLNEYYMAYDKGREDKITILPIRKKLRGKGEKDSFISHFEKAEWIVLLNKYRIAVVHRDIIRTRRSISWSRRHPELIFAPYILLDDPLSELKKTKENREAVYYIKENLIKIDELICSFFDLLLSEIKVGKNNS